MASPAVDMSMPLVRRNQTRMTRRQFAQSARSPVNGGGLSPPPILGVAVVDEAAMISSLCLSLAPSQIFSPLSRCLALFLSLFSTALARVDVAVDAVRYAHNLINPTHHALFHYTSRITHRAWRSATPDASTRAPTQTQGNTHIQTTHSACSMHTPTARLLVSPHYTFIISPFFLAKTILGHHSITPLHPAASQCPP